MAARAVSPSTVTKRGREEDEEPAAQPRRRRRTEETTERTREDPVVSEDQPDKESLKEIVLTELCSTDEEILVEALRKLVALLRVPGASDEKKLFLAVGGHLAVARVMKEHRNNTVIQIKGFVVFMSAACMFKDAQSAITLVGGIDAIVAAATTFSTDRQVFLRALGALINLTIGQEDSSSLVVNKLDGIPLIVEGMSRFPDDASVVYNACKLLKVLCGYKELRKQILSDKALIALATAITRHENDGDIMRFARTAMKRLLED